METIVNTSVPPPIRINGVPVRVGANYVTMPDGTVINLKWTSK